MLGDADPTIEPTLLALADGELLVRARALGIRTELFELPPALAALGESTAGHRSVGRAMSAVAALGRAAPGFVLGLRRRVRAIGPALVHTNGMKAHLLCRLALPELPHVVHLRDFPSERPLTRHALRLFATRRVMLITNSRAVERDAKALAPGVHTRVVYNGVDLDEFSPGPRELSPLATLAALEPPAPDAVVIGMVATYAWWKGQVTFVRAMAEVVRAAPDLALRFYVIGGPIYATAGSEITREQLRGEIQRAGLERVVGLVPFQRDPARIYRGLDVVVHASTRPEPFGRTIVEGMATGRAVLAARAGGAAELIDEGITGLFHRPGDEADLARAVLELSRDPALRARLGARAREAACARFDRRRLGAELSDVYRALLSQRA